MLADNAFPSMKTCSGSSPLLEEIYMSSTTLLFPLVIPKNKSNIPELKRYMTRLEIGSCCGLNYVNSVFKLDSFPRLTAITIGHNSFPKCTSLHITNNPLLTTVNIEQNCFIKKLLGNTGFIVQNCPQLTMVSLGRNSLPFVSSVTLKQLPKLSMFSFSSDCFKMCDSFQMVSVDMLQVLIIPNGSMPFVSSVVLDSLPQLRKLVLGLNCWTGNRVAGSSFTCQRCDYDCILCRVYILRKN